ncbi:conserved virulence factor C family protein [Bacillus sp. FJAT-49732]|uniref:Conserved virulence factor C family protein n=1 Tax=Lederbergia citrisecunda TaxID=2833583 RepID=A0A942TMG2_9BACI|nr:conserved virulence factor C family protein [Lederbergia citrisecunda]MBS4199441.1 conserved virulence factor C family protein [Lederbergia citrisecunda]
MKIITIEPTPSPNTMKIVLDEALVAGKNNNYKKENAEGAPPVIKNILNIEGVNGVYHVADFLAVERNGKYSWEVILPLVREAFGEESIASNKGNQKPDEHFGEVNVQIQLFKDIPLQVKLTSSNEEKRFGLPNRFQEAMSKAQLPEDNYILLRKWKDVGVRYGDLDQVGKEVVDELGASYPEERLRAILERALNPTAELKHIKKLIKLTPNMLDDPDWKKRYQLLEQMQNPTLEDLPVLEKALSDEKLSIRRLAVVYLGMIEDKRVLPLLYKGLRDKTVTVRRTAGDCLSDLGFPDAMDEMCEALKDKSRIVRWRAAMFLYEVGDERSLPALKEAENDQEFEVQLQIKMAIERIEGGEEAKGSVWKQMTEARSK